MPANANLCHPRPLFGHYMGIKKAGSKTISAGGGIFWIAIFAYIVNEIFVKLEYLASLSTYRHKFKLQRGSYNIPLRLSILKFIKISGEAALMPINKGE